ncbi:tRNA-ribosyltransferase [Pyrobaculum sp.]|uniref:tRNA-ribosyltransferase n=1 Tax=Pyrobaculum sp. TaxID=2004705 RepID=UPI003D12B9AA
MRIVLGTPINAVPRPWLYFDVPALMINALEVKRDPRAVLGYEGELWVDSGGYQILRKGLSVDVDKIAEVYRRVDAQLYLSLDVPPSPGDPSDVAEKKFEKTYRNWVRLRRAVGDSVVPVLHVYRDEALFFRYLRLYLDAPALAIGAAVPYVLITRGAPPGSRMLALRLIARARREFRGPLHVLGMGSPSVTPILHAMGVDSTDSATWRLKAAYGKVILPGGGERHVTDRAVNFGRAKPRDGELEELYHFLRETGFPALDGFYERIKTSFEYRALVNAWVVTRSWTQPPRTPVFKKLYQAVATA